jgi:hypothetical protein
MMASAGLYHSTGRTSLNFNNGDADVARRAAFARIPEPPPDSRHGRSGGSTSGAAHH